MAVAVRTSSGTGNAVATRTCVAVVMGGTSAEREVSFESGRAVLEALRGAGMGAFPFDPAESSLGEMLKRSPTTAFLALHGGEGEDGSIQRRLDDLGVGYTGSGPEACAAAMDKEVTKRAFCRGSIPTPPFRIVESGALGEAEALCADLGYPLVIKPVSEGSSLGVSVAGCRYDLIEGLEKAFRYGPRAVVEKRIEGREFCVGILGRETLPLVEVAYADAFFSYEAKYHDPRTAYIFDHGLPRTVERLVERTALAAFDALGCRHFARVDVMVSYGDLAPYVLEVNALPGLTSHSLLPMAARRAGLGFTDLCRHILDLAGEADVW